MKNSIKIESQAFALEARKPMRVMAAASGGIGVPLLAKSLFQAMIFLFIRQMMPQTFSIMTQPMPPPTPIASSRLLSQP